MTEKTKNIQDLRIKKTKRAILAAFNELLKEKPLDKISVTELAQRAEINKGTFYLHYTDIYALYQEALQEHMEEMVEKIPFFEYLLRDPRRFSEMFINKSKERNLRFSTDPYLSKSNGHWNRNAVSYFSDAIGDKAVLKAGLEPTEENRIKLMYLFAGAGSLIHMESDTNHAMLVDMLTNTIYALFPDAKK
jgi:Transcriptional regulator